MKAKKSISLILVVIMVISMLSGCSKATENDIGNGNSDNDGGEKVAKDTLTILVKAEPQTIDPAYQNNENIGLVTNFIFDGLFDLDAEGKIINGLAENYEVVDDTTVRFKLKEGIKYSDGSDMTSKDVLFDIKRLQESAVSQSHYNFVDLEKSIIEDDLNFVLKFKQAWAPFQNTMTTGRGSIYSQAAFDSLGAEKFARAPIGTGPYKVVNWISGTQIELTRNEYYWGNPPKTKNIIIKFVAEPTARVIELETNAADISYYIEGTDIDRVNNIEGYHIEQGDSYRYFVLCMSMQEPLFQDVRVRQAMKLAINKEALVKTATNGVAKPINGYCSPIIEGYMEMPQTPTDIEKAKSLLAEAGYPKGFEIELHVEPNTMYQRLAEVVQAMWTEIGIKANIVSSPLATYEAQKKGKFQASIRDGNASEISNVLVIYESTFGSRLQGNDDWLDAKLLELRTYYYGDPKREAALKEIYNYLDEKVYTYPFMVMPTVYGVSNKVEGFIFHPIAMNIDPTSWVVYE
jgi:peptide/nickel transport system substrate-binding protein